MPKFLWNLILIFVWANHIYGDNANNLYFDTLRYNLVEGLPDIYIDPFSEKIGCTWRKGLVYDKSLIQKVYSILAKHNKFFVAIDLGAQTGSFSLLAKFFPNSHWYAFEPIQEAVDTLKINLVLNDIQNVFVYHMAVSNFSGWATLRLPNINEWGLSTLGTNVLRFRTTEERIVKCVDLDSFIAENHIEKVHFMKMDTEGSEFGILQGAKNLIKRDHPVILMEYNPTNARQCGILLKTIDSFLQAMGYEWTLVSGEDILCIYKEG